MTNYRSLALEFCADLMSDHVSFLVALLRAALGELHRVDALCAEAGLAPPKRVGPGVDLRVAWLTDPVYEGYVTVMFYSRQCAWMTYAFTLRPELRDAPRKTGETRETREQE